VNTIGGLSPFAVRAVVVNLAAGLALAAGIGLAGPANGIPLVDAAAAVALGIALAVAVLSPEAGLVMTLVYAASPLSFYILFRDTGGVSPYPASRDLAIDAIVTLGLSGAATVGALIRSWGAGEPLLPRLPAQRPLLATGAVLALTALIGLIAGNPLPSLLADLVPVLELGVLLLLTAKLVDTRAKAVTLVRAVAIALTVSALVRLALYLQGPGSFGVESVALGGAARPRLFQVYPFGWILPFAIAYVLAADRWRERLVGIGLALVCGVMVVLSFERGLWVIAAIASVPVVLWGVRRRPRLAGALLASGIVAFVLIGGLVGGGSGFTDPVTLIRQRLAYTTDQLQGSGIQNKRQDEATALWHAIRRDPAGWPLGHGLGAEYVGPTGIREGDYAGSFRKKHYSFDWYLAMLFRTGAIGLGVAVWLVLALGAVGLRAFRRGGSLLTQGTGLAVICALLGLAVIAPIDPYLIAHPLAVFQGATVALVALLLRGGAAPADARRPAGGGG
jgi:hypothetical protein